MLKGFLVACTSQSAHYLLRWREVRTYRVVEKQNRRGASGPQRLHEYR